MPHSAVSIGNFGEDAFDFEGPMVVRDCELDANYPLSLEWVTTEGHDVSLSLSIGDIEQLRAYFQFN